MSLRYSQYCMFCHLITDFGHVFEWRWPPPGEKPRGVSPSPNGQTSERGPEEVCLPLLIVFPVSLIVRLFYNDSTPCKPELGLCNENFNNDILILLNYAPFMHYTSSFRLFYFFQTSRRRPQTWRGRGSANRAAGGPGAETTPGRDGR